MQTASQGREVTQAVNVVPVVLEGDAADRSTDCGAAMSAAQAAELHSAHIETCVHEAFDAKNVAIVAYGDSHPRGRAMLCMPGADCTSVPDRKDAASPLAADST